MDDIVKAIDAEITARTGLGFFTAYTMEIEKAKAVNQGEITGLKLAKQIMQSKNNKIAEARYTHMINDSNYSELLCTFEDGDEKTFNFCASNPMPKEYVVQGLTWDELRGVCMGMWRMAVNECIKVNHSEV